MGAEDMRRQAPNVDRMRLLGAEVVPVELGTKTLREATSEAIRDWLTNVETTHYLLGSCVGPHPYPEIVHELQAVIGREARAQILAAESRLPEVAVACVGGGSNAIGLFAGFVADADVRLSASRRQVRPASGSGRAWRAPRRALVAARGRRRPGARRALDLGGPRLPGRRAGARVPPRSGRAEYVSATDAEALTAFRDLARTEGILPALEPAHALARARELDDELILVCLSGRGDKDLAEVIGS